MKAKTTKQSILDRVLIDPNTECWLWQGKPSRDGANGKLVSVHRAMYEERNGKVPDGFSVYRKCGNTLCCALEHLYVMPNGNVPVKITLVKSRGSL